MKKILLAFAALATAGAAQADIIPTLTASSPVLVGSLYQYTYTATLAADQELQTGNYFTIYDFQGFDHFGTLGEGFTGLTSLLGITPSRVLPMDDPTVLNATFKYMGPTLNRPSGDGQGVSTELGSFQIYSKFNGLGLIDFASEGTKNNGLATGTLVDNVGSTAGPLAGGIGSTGGGVGSTVPEPANWVLLIAGFASVGVVARSRRTVLSVAT